MGVFANICPENVIFWSVKAIADRTFLERFLNHTVFKGIPRSFDPSSGGGKWRTFGVTYSSEFSCSWRHPSGPLVTNSAVEGVVLGHVKWLQNRRQTAGVYSKSSVETTSNRAARAVLKPHFDRDMIAPYFRPLPNGICGSTGWMKFGDGSCENFVPLGMLRV